MNKHYSGIGSRDTPEPILSKMKTLAGALAELHFTLRSGGAEGADTAFEEGCVEHFGEKEIYLPWRNFNDNKSHFHSPTSKAVLLAEKAHPAYPYLKHGAQLLIARNMHQILGYDLDEPSLFVVCWTEDGAETEAHVKKTTGGTGSAIKLAAMNSIPVFNLSNEGRLEQLYDYIANIGE